ncbi:hypothetical protein CASFOL_018102 [Castilleja foliolosa]|uniref:Transposase, Ptta/En/Spm, plant n=1 Tax=Castilleja foliolosa TaxID=1961234 RepID=A0ABD3DA41_9LAMI
MAPGVTAAKQKPKFVRNHKSINSTPRCRARVRTAEHTESCPNESTLIPKSTEVPSKQLSQTDSDVSRTQSNVRQTKLTIRQTPSTGLQTKSILSRQTPPTGIQTKSTGLQTQLPSRKTIQSALKACHNPPAFKHQLQNMKTNHRPSQSTGRQSQANAPHIETHGLRDEETDIQTQSTDNTGAASQDETTETEAVDPAIGRPTHRLESAKFSSQVGVVACDVLPVVRKWKEVDVISALEPCIDHMLAMRIERLKNSSRQQHRLHVHYKRFPNVEEAKRNKPTAVTDREQWEQLFDHINSPEFKNQSQANSNNRKKVQAKHSTGQTPFTIIQNEISRKKGDDCDVIELYKLTHENVNGKWSSNVAQENWELMMEKKAKYAEQGTDKSEQEIMTELLGLANGYIKGLGYGPKPPSKRNSELKQELEETRAKLEESRSDTAAYKSKVNALTDQLKEQGAQIAKLMAFMEAGGRKNQENTNQNQMNEEDDNEDDQDEDVEQEEDEDIEK